MSASVQKVRTIMDEPLDDFEVLVRRAVQGEAGALTELLTAQQDWLTEFVAPRLDRKLAPRLDVGDIIQDVLIEAARKLPDYVARCPIPFTAWIKSIAEEHLVKVRRRHMKAGKRTVFRDVSAWGAGEWSSDDALAPHPKSKDKTPSSYVAGKELYAEVARLMQQLSENDQKLIRLRFIEQRPAKDVALELGTTEHAVHMRQLRALRQLRDLLEPRGPGGETA